MVVTINQVKEAFLFLYQQILEQGFTKASYFPWWSERELLPLIRFYLLGYFGVLEPEADIEFLTNVTGRGRVDFLIENVAVEFATRTPDDSPSKIDTNTNQSELIKLMRYGGPSALVLFDFSETPFTPNDLEAFRAVPSLGRGNFNKYPFSILYYFQNEHSSPDVIRKNISP